MERRNFIRASILAASAVPVASYSRVSTGVEGAPIPQFDIPAYSNWPPAQPRTNDFVLFTHLNTQHLPDENEGTQTPTPTPTQTPTSEENSEVLVTLPTYGFVVTAIWFYYGMVEYPWDGTLGDKNEPAGMRTDAMTMTENTFIFHGSYDPGMFVDNYSDGFEQTEVGGFTVFRGQARSDTEKLAYAVSDEAVVAVIEGEPIRTHEEAIAVLTNALTNRVNEVNRVVDQDDGTWLFESTGPADSATGMWRVNGVQPEDWQIGEEQSPNVEANPVFDNVDSYISMLALPTSEGGVGGDQAAARFAALYPEGEVPTKAELRNELLPDDRGVELQITTLEDRAYVASRR